MLASWRPMDRYRHLTDAAVDAWNRQDLDAWLALADPAIEYHTSRNFPGLRPVYRGYDELREFWLAMHEPWETLRVDLERYAEGEDWTAVEFRFRAKGAESGATVDMVFCNVTRLRNDRACKIFGMRSYDEALREIERGGLA
jgi:ketosteroid isomerase-like protein